MFKKVLLAMFFGCFVGATTLAQNEPGYNVKLTRPEGLATLAFADEYIEISFSPTVHLNFTLTNKTGQALEVNWQRASFVDIHGQVHGVIHDDIRDVKKLNVLPPSIVGPAGKLQRTVVAAGLITQDAENEERWLLKGLFHGGMALYVDKPFSLVLPIKIGTESREYAFTFVVEKK